MRGYGNQALLEQLLAAECESGGWSYAPGGRPSAEPTAWACLALSGHGAARETNRRGLDFLARVQRSDGGVPTVDIDDPPCWPTGPAILAWMHGATSNRAQHANEVRRGVDWLLKNSGEPAPFNPTVYGHDTSLIGWSWVAGTHSWVEPTGYALLALDAAGKGEHPQAVEGRRLLRDRAIPGGGWNYGNAKVFGATLRPFPGTTGVALMALAGRPADAATDSGIEYLLDELPRVRSPMSLSWGVMALTAWNRCPELADQWLAETGERALRVERNPLHAALLLLAGLDPCPLVRHGDLVEVGHG